MITEAEALQIAKAECDKRSWPWLEPIDISSPWFSNNWLVRTNWGSLGTNAEITIKKSNGQVLKALFLPR